MSRFSAFIVLMLFSFVLSGADVSKHVQVLGKPFRKGAYSRNVWDMKVFDGRIWLGHGNGAVSGVEAKSGPVPVVYYDLSSGKFGSDFILDENQLDSFLEIDGSLVIPGSDSRLDDVASFYRLEGKGVWKRYPVFNGVRRVFDMRKYAGRLFASFETDGRTPSFAVSDDSGLTWSHYPEAGTARRHEIFELNGLLYTPGDFLPSSTPVRASEAFFEYAGENLVIRDELSSQVLFPSLDKGYYTMRRCVLFGGRVVYLGGRVWNDNAVSPDGVFYLSSLARGRSSVTSVSLPRKSVPRDILVRDGRLFILTDDLLADGSFIIRVFATTDFKEWNELFSFKRDTFARSFELVDGDFYFGLGTDTGGKGSYGKLSQSSGTILKLPKEAYLPSSTLSYTVCEFSESPANDGSMDSSLPSGIYLTGDLFTGADGEDFVASRKVSFTGLPEGLTPVMKRKSPTVIEFTLKGSAKEHGYIEGGVPFTVSFKNTAFRGGSSARLKGSRTEFTVLFGRFSSIKLSFTGKGSGQLYPSDKEFYVPYGQAVMIRCVPERGYMFNGWKLRKKKDGSRPAIKFADRTKPFTSVAFAEDVEVVADVVKGGVVLEVESSHAASKVLPVPGRFTTVMKGTGVKLTAEPERGVVMFKEWRLVGASGESVITDARARETSVILANDTRVRAEFVPCRYLLNVEGGLGTGVYASGAKVTVKAAPPPDGMIFDFWEGLKGSESRKSVAVVDVVSNMTLRAQYRAAPKTEYKVAVSGGSGGGEYLEGARVSLIAQSAPAGRMFDHWEGDVEYLTCANNPEQAFVMPSRSLSLQAVFKDAPGEEYRFVYGGVTAMYRPGTLVKLRADAVSRDGIFDHWEGGADCVGDTESPETTLRMPAEAVTLHAVYRAGASRRVKVSLSVSPSGAGEFVSVDPKAFEAYKGVCSFIRAKGSAGYVFERWETSDNVILATPDGLSTTFLPDGDCSLRAVFRKRGE